ncbi:unnamed protein product [Hymenolepis diminuta]|uniref:HTH_48 domain-containing protein n=1 Tax=Hymenolepis diminuta TaxID=6216 RepID=A0A564YWI9_HYMDI|nr:unnamed protein product [Hymenolepis diminuta]
MLNKLHSGQLQAAIDENPICTTRELSKTFHVSCHMTIFREMKRLGCESLKGWEIDSPHDLSEINKQQRLACFTANFLL